MSFNVQVTLPKTNGILTSAAQNRISAVSTEIQSYMPDIIGLQEDTKTWNDELAKLLDGYTAVQDTSITTAGAERCAIWYKSDLNVLESGYQWLRADGKEGPAITIAELTNGDGFYDLSPAELETLGLSASTDNSALSAKREYTNEATQTVQTYEYLSARRMTYVVLNVNGHTVICVNTHLQHRGQNELYMTPELTKLRNYERLAEFDLLQRRVEELQAKYPNAVVTLTGDFNDVVGSEIYNKVAQKYQDSASVAAVISGEKGTWNSFFDYRNQGDSYPNTSISQSKTSLDFCWVSENATVSFYRSGLGYATIPTEDGKLKTLYTSDHRLIVSDICF